MAARQALDPLERYRAMRSASPTPEPSGAAPGPAAAPAGLFVVQRHAARRLHYDFRLEHEGVLLSWAVPKGPSADPAEKRLAVRVEEHPVEYAGFEGVIPAGSYGAGAVIVWDRGTFRFLEDPAEGLRRGKLLFELHGLKLRGVWTLVRTRRAERDWLLVKHRDAFAGAGQPAFAAESVVSGRTVEDVAAGRPARRPAELERLGAPRRPVEPGVRPMLAEARPDPFSGAGWIFEIKYDGFRALARREGGAAAILYRSGRDATALYPEIAAGLRALACEQAVLDGEVVVLDSSGAPSFPELQRRALLSRRADVERAARERPAALVAFDLLSLDGFDLRDLPLLERKALLARLVPRDGPVRWADHVEERGEDFFLAARARGLEGMVAKRADSRYRCGRSPAWLKVRSERADDFAVVGYTAPAGARSGFGALHLAFHDGRGLVYAGSVGTGFAAGDLPAIRARLEPGRRAGPACRGPAPAGKGNVWVEPELACEVRYLAWTRDGLLRQPVFLRLREDKRADECQVRGPGAADEPAAAGAPAASPAGSPGERRVSLTRLDKVYWPGEGITKGDLVAYYRAVAPWILPYLRDRPLVLTRYPDGIRGKSFFQRNAPLGTPPWVRTLHVPGTEPGSGARHLVCDDLESLLQVVNLGSIPLHVGASRAQDLDRPDWCVVDLDPKGAPFAHVVRIARRLHELCEEVGLPSFAKTTGQAGLHVLVPLGRRCTHAQARDLALVLARVVAEGLEDVATLARPLGQRGGRVYLDCLQNGPGKTVAAPFCVRPLPGAPVSTPLRWSEVNGRLDPRRFTLRNVPRRMRRLGADPLRPVLDLAPDLVGALARLAARAGERRPRPA